MINFEPYPFEKLRNLIGGLTPKKELINMSIGEPQFATPQPIIDVLNAHTALFNKYPASAGVPKLKEMQIKFVQTRFNISLNDDQILPTLGTREALFNFPQSLLFDQLNPVIAHPNPFYQIYEGAVKACRAKQVLLDLTQANDFKPDIDDPRLKNCDLVILNSPNNPTGSVLTISELTEWVKLSAKYGFVLLNDECYSEIYHSAPPPSLLEASIAAGNADFHHIIVMNSLSKRSSAAGLRSGFAAGDSEILKQYAVYRSYAGATAGVPLQIAAAWAWGDEIHAAEIRKKYAENMNLARKLLGVSVSDASFYIWLKVGDDIAAAKTLYKEFGLTVLPGTFLSRSKAQSGFVRIALVYDEARTIEALTRLKEFLTQ